jgi:hypothetical protein
MRTCRVVYGQLAALTPFFRAAPTAAPEQEDSQ